jgi:hypothetical protein
VHQISAGRSLKFTLCSLISLLFSSQLFAQSPAITSISPSSAPVGAAVTITGTNFGSAQGTSTVVFNGNAAVTIGSWSATAIVATVPTGATTGNVVVTVSGTASNGVALTIIPLPSRPGGSTLDTSNSLVTDLVGLFIMNEESGTSDEDLVDSQAANFAGGSQPTWNTGDPSIVFNGGSSLNSYVDAGTDLTFDKLTVNQMTVVAAYTSTLLRLPAFVKRTTTTQRILDLFSDGTARER